MRKTEGKKKEILLEKKDRWKERYKIKREKVRKKDRWKERYKGRVRERSVYIKRVTKRKAVNIERKRKISKRKTEEKGIRKNFLKFKNERWEVEEKGTE